MSPATCVRCARGGSLPAIVEADDGFLYVINSVGQGGGETRLDCRIDRGRIGPRHWPQGARIGADELDDSFSKTEADEEIQDF